MNKRTVGRITEDRAATFLQEQGYGLIAQNVSCRIGEIDIVATEGDTLVFAEVKYRRTDAYGLPEQAVGIKKQVTIRRCAQWYMQRNRIPEDVPVRFDVIAMDEHEIRLYRDAF